MEVRIIPNVDDLIFLEYSEQNIFRIERKGRAWLSSSLLSHGRGAIN